MAYMQGACGRCVIDNTSVIISHGAGPDASFAPEMAAFAGICSVHFWAHRINDPNRKARIERPFDYVERNFLAGRTFTDWQDLNLQARQWCDQVANRKPKRSLGMSPTEAWLMEKPSLQPLPKVVPPVYLAEQRTVDIEGYVHLDTNRYSVPDTLIGKNVEVLKYWQRVVIYHKSSFQGKLYLLDATVINLCLSVFPWAEFRQIKGVVKLHMGLGADGYIPAFMDMTSGKVHEINWARTLKLPKGSFVCFDRGFTDYAWYNDLTTNSIFFVTRLKSNADVEYLLKRAGRKSPGITNDQAIRHKGVQGASSLGRIHRCGNR